MSFSYPTFCQTGGYNELIDRNGEIRPHWRFFYEAACQSEENRFQAYSEQTARLMNADLLADAAGQKAVHGVIPFILSGQDFKTISAGLIQRAELFNQILCDLYGEQKLIRDGVIAPQVMNGKTGFVCFLMELMMNCIIVMVKWLV